MGTICAPFQWKFTRRELTRAFRARMRACFKPIELTQASAPPGEIPSVGAAMDFDVIKQLLASLEKEGVRYAIFGAVAMNLHGLARFTEDLDIFVEPEADNIQRLRVALHAVIEDPEIESITAEDLLGDYPAVQYIPPDGFFHVDILTRLGDAFSFSDLETERIALDDIMVSVVTPRTLYKMKKNTLRLKDHADAQMLKERFGFADEEDR
jgi:Nucleotidyl transferase AbiEii toxin, Type IV TA system